MEQDYEYVHGSAARKLDYDVYKENKVLKAKKIYKNNRKAKLRLVLSILAILAAGLVIMYRYAMITQMSYSINQSEQKYYDLRNENSKIKVQVEQDTDLTSIREQAETRLGMQMPDKSQIVYISVAKKDHTVVMNTKDEDTAGTDKLTAFINRFAGLFSLFN